MRAWKESPAHYANLIDADYTSIGVSLIGGTYEGIDTVYFALHFAAPSVPIPSDPIGDIRQQKAKKGFAEQAKKGVLAEKILRVSPSPLGKYLTAKESFSERSVFQLSRSVHAAHGVLFAIALFLAIFIEIKKQHPRAVLLATGLLGLQVCFWFF